MASVQYFDPQTHQGLIEIGDDKCLGQAISRCSNGDGRPAEGLDETLDAVRRIWENAPSNGALAP